MKNRRNYYRILHVQADAPEAIIRASYRTLMQKLKLHPDLGGDEWDATLLNEAYATLSDPDRRAAYDRTLGQQNTSRNQTARKPAPTVPDNDPHHTDHSKVDPKCPFCATRLPVHGGNLAAVECPDCASPLQPVIHVRLEAACQRAVTRIPKSAPLAFFTTENRMKGYAGTLLDLSISGLQFLSDYRLHTQQIIKITTHALSATARVTHSRRHSGGRNYMTGVEFITLRFHASQGTFISEKA